MICLDDSYLDEHATALCILKTWVEQPQATSQRFLACCSNCVIYFELYLTLSESALIQHIVLQNKSVFI